MEMEFAFDFLKKLELDGYEYPKVLFYSDKSGVIFTEVGYYCELLSFDDLSDLKQKIKEYKHQPSC